MNTSIAVVMFMLLNVLLVLLLPGCAGVAPKAEDLAPPSPRLMAAPVPLPDVAENEDVYGSNVQCSGAYVRETGRLRSLQTYVRTVTRKN